MPFLNKLTIVGIGLLGGSIAAAAKDKGITQQCVGIDCNAQHLQYAKQLNLIDSIGALDAETLQDTELLIFCTPVSTLPALIRKALPFLPSTAIISDVGSTKASLVAAIAPELHLHKAVFIPAHPIAGSQHNGPQAAQANLFENKPILLTPLDNTPDWALNKLREFWRLLGGNITEGSPQWHDEVFAEISHAPHLLSFLAVDLINKQPEADKLWALAGNGLRDFTRIGASHPDMWRDISLENRDAILNSLKRYRIGLDEMIHQLENNDIEALYTLFKRAQAARKKRWD
ncbi:MAG: prephenate dehydrogenase/arogenate dehydrogenase family protein [Pseudomonadota bacterium]